MQVVLGIESGYFQPYVHMFEIRVEFTVIKYPFKYCQVWSEEVEFSFLVRSYWNILLATGFSLFLER